MTFKTKTLLIMKLLMILLTVAALQVSAGSTAQTITYRGKDVPLEKIFKAIKKQTGFAVAFDADQLRKARHVNVDVSGVSLESFLKQVLKGQPLEYSIENTTVFIYPGRPQPVAPVVPPAGVLTSGPEEKQLIDVKGSITNENGEPVIASVTIKGTKRGVTSDINGSFGIAGVPEDAVLIISATNIVTQEIHLASQISFFLTIKVTTKMANMGEVVVNKGYYSEKQRQLTGDVSTVKAADIEKQPITNPLQAIQGRVPGLFITQQTGVAGGAYDVLIRGRNSLVNGNNPFYVVDGVPYTQEIAPDASTFATSPAIGGSVAPSPLNYLNPSEIESIDVLKDADATAIYGSRGANGVILITTKKGISGKANFNVNVYKGFAEVGHFMKMLNSQQWVALRKEAFKNDNATPGSLDYDLNGTWDQNSYTDWQRELFGKKAQATDAQASISGGNGRVQYMASGGYHKETSIFPGDYANTRGSVHLSLTTASDDQKFKMQWQASYISSVNTLPSTDMTSDSRYYPVSPKIFDSTGGLNWQNSTWTNPFSRFKALSKVNTQNLIANVNMSYEILKGLLLKVSSGYTRMDMDDHLATPSTYYRPILNRTTGSTDFSSNNASSWIFEPQLNYSIKLGEGNINALIGYTGQQNHAGNYMLHATGYPDNSLLETLAAAGAITKGPVYDKQYKYSAGFGRLNYNWKEKYIVNVTARRDGSSRFGPDRRFNNFEAVGAAWIFSNEHFFSKALPFVSFGKLRASYGTSGSDQIPEYSALSLYDFTSFDPTFQTTQGLYPNGLSNPDIAWESSRKAEIGLELGLWNDKIFLSASYYRNRSSNQLVSTPLPSITGFQSIQANLPATVQNAGTEFLLRTNFVRTKDWNWVSSINFTAAANKLISFPDLANSSYASSFVVGQPITIWQVYDITGVDPQTGLYTYKGADGKQTSDPDYLNDRIQLMNVDPRFYGGFQNTLSYKNVDLDFFVQFVKQVGDNPLVKNTVLPGIFSRLTPYNLPADILKDHWQNPGDKATIQKFSRSLGDAQTAYAATALSRMAFTDASFIRLKNVSLSYRLAPTLLRTLHLKKMRVYLQGQNLVTWTKYIGMDPENQNRAIPPLRVWTGGIEIGL